MFIKSFLTFAFKIILFWKNGAITLISFVASFFSTIILTKLNDIFFKNADPQYIWTPIVLETLMIVIFHFMITIDFYFGHRVAVSIRKEKFDWDRCFDTIAKECAIILMTSVVVVFAIISGSLKIETSIFGMNLSLSIVLTGVLSFIWFYTIWFEFGSIGRHIENLTGIKYPIFAFFDDLMKWVKKNTLDRASNLSFKPKENEENNNTDSN